MSAIRLSPEDYLQDIKALLMPPFLTLGARAGRLWFRKWPRLPVSPCFGVNPWSPGGSFMVQKMAATVVGEVIDSGNEGIHSIFFNNFLSF